MPVMAADTALRTDKIGASSGYFCADAYVAARPINNAAAVYENLASLQVDRDRAVAKSDGLVRVQNFIFTNAKQQYGPNESFIFQHELQLCDDDTQFIVALDLMQSHIIALSALRMDKPLPAVLSKDEQTPSLLTEISYICDFRAIAKRLGRDTMKSIVYEKLLRDHFAGFHTRVPAPLCAL